MSSSHVRTLEWLNNNSQRAYPLKEDTSRLDSITQSYRLVDDFIVDLIFVIGVNKDKRFFLRYLSVIGTIATGQIYDEDGNPAATFTVDTDLHARYQHYVLAGAGKYTGSRGKIVIGEVQNLLSSPNGLFEFGLADTEFEPTTILPDIRGVSSISKQPEAVGDEFPQLVDHVLIGAGFNTRVRLDQATNSIRVDAIEGEGLGPICDCPTDQVLGPCISTINGIGPDPSFNFNIRGVGCIEITPIESGISIANTCVTNCCDCAEIDALEARVKVLEIAAGSP